jgi:ABC-2 type transport system ATP-binding protein
MLEILQLKKYYGNRVILDIPKLSITPGVYWISGKNGSGKTTLLKIIGATIPFEGTVTFNAINLRSDPMLYRKQVTFVEAEPRFPGFLTGWEILRFIQKIRNESDQSVMALVRHFGIQNFLDFPVGTYSSGTTKKLSLVQAFIGKPKLILLDEPLITLDNEAIPLLSSLIRERMEKDVSFLFTSHQPFPEDLITPTSCILMENLIA